ncbi:hypothetical protein GGQ22_13665 [Nocardioides sp. zg-579]|uniref:Alpha/beta hydrolase n=1 Tax=Nocardioides marmotae TaxID=2663857 RepID=A0A6I3JDH2_9ACTN|nr:hypothetical protein [Nocardioides marmotae]MCR6032479.1 hypothetical protein [Gordonia jinghuaiqii]MTB96128.1 hypothetical protein [Nocardioides marmotae]QKD99795.1 hypothetical protein HPC71_00810 [Nocardioides marmotae]
MSGSEVPEVTEVTGGSHGLAAAYAAVRALADDYDRAGDRLRGWAEVGRRTALDDDLLESAALAPVTFAEAEAAVLGAATGPDGALVASLGWEADAVAVRAGVVALQGADDLARAAFDVLDHALGRAIGTLLPATLPALLPLLPTAPLLATVLGPEADALLAEAVAEHPDLVQHLVNGSGGLLDGLLLAGVLRAPWRLRDTEAAAAALAAAYGDPGRGRARRLGTPRTTRQPGGLADLLADLDEVHRAGGDGTIEVRTATAPDGSVRHVVHLPGTDDLATLPWTQDDDARDLAANLLLVAGLDNPHQQGVLDAMAQAGIGPEDPVLLVGHSQGGMVAAAVLAAGGPFHVTDVVTAGAPTAHLDGFPPGSHVLSLEHRGDLVPLLDGEDNRDTLEQTTVRFAGAEGGGGGSGVAAAHGIGHYVAAAAVLEAAAADGTAHPSVLDALRRLEEQGYVAGPAGTVVTSQAFQVVREP